MFSGLAQTGAWSCFDEFNRIEVEVLSVVAQQILTIITAVTEGKSRFLFEGREIKLDPTCGIFVTMNPGYAGRSELPENLKALLRPMSMMTPNVDLIIEIMLFSEGFSTSMRPLAKRMFTLYYLMVQQLSKQDHYDFGLRSVKSVLNSAGALKRGDDGSTQEDVLLLRADSRHERAQVHRAGLPALQRPHVRPLPRRRTAHRRLRQAAGRHRGRARHRRAAEGARASSQVRSSATSPS